MKKYIIVEIGSVENRGRLLENEDGKQVFDYEEACEIINQYAQEIEYNRDKDYILDGATIFYEEDHKHTIIRDDGGIICVEIIPIEL